PVGLPALVPDAEAAAYRRAAIRAVHRPAVRDAVFLLAGGDLLRVSPGGILRLTVGSPGLQGFGGRCFGWFEEALVAEPVDAAIGPGSAGVIDFPHTEVVRASRIDVQSRRDAGALQGQVHDHAVARVADDGGPAMDEEDRWCFRRNAQAGSEFLLVLGLQVA